MGRSVRRAAWCGLAAAVLAAVSAASVFFPAPSLFAEEAAPAVTAHDREFWSFRRVTRPAVPAIRHAERERTAIDSFLLERLESHGLGFAPDADRRTLIRRVSLDLIGIPPSPAEVHAFLADDAPDAYERLIDRLLASPHFGERWARHWLDAVGYVDTVGFDVDADLIITSDGKWRYRDYVVGAFNADRPYDRFLTEQIAGDELVDWRNASEFTPRMLDDLIATGFLRTAQDFTHEDVGNIPQNHYGVLHDTIEIVGSSLLGLTLNCARCHSHKFDPVPQEDYYRLMAVLTPAYNPQHWKIVFPYDKSLEDRALPDVSPAQKASIDAHNAAIDAQVEACTRKLDDVRRPVRELLLEQKLAQVPEAERSAVREAVQTAADKRNKTQQRLAARFENALRVSPDDVSAALSNEQHRSVAALNEEMARLKAGRRAYGKIQALYDVGAPPVTRQLIGGNYDTPGQEIEPGVLQVLCDDEASPLLSPTPPYTGTSGRRLAFARWLTAPGSRPAGLAARVMVNRVWQHLFGGGIVSTPDNFGVGGNAPSHPELLEWLSAELMENGWRIKPLVRMAVLSTAYRQSAEGAPAGDASPDPDNVLLWKMRLKRLESEAIRDSILTVGGTIDRRMGGAPILLEFRPADGMIVIAEKQLPDAAAKGRRSIYLLARRAFQLSELAVFDQPVVATNCPQRHHSAVPLQSLSMLNGPLLWDQSERLADRIGQAAPGDRNAQIAAAFELALGREPSQDERDWSAALCDRQAALYRESTPGDAPEKIERRALVHFCHALLNVNEFLYVP